MHLEKARIEESFVPERREEHIKRFTAEIIGKRITAETIVEKAQMINATSLTSLIANIDELNSIGHTGYLQNLRKGAQAVLALQAGKGLTDSLEEAVPPVSHLDALKRIDVHGKEGDLFTLSMIENVVGADSLGNLASHDHGAAQRAERNQRQLALISKMQMSLQGHFGSDLSELARMATGLRQDKSKDGM